MKRVFKVIALGILAGQMVFAGGIVTNSNQSAKWVRMLSRDASTDIDAIYYNPAGVTALTEGLHFSLSNQSIFQEYTLNSALPTLNDGTYLGEVSAPLYPNVYASYNKEKWAAFMGFEIIGGGGSAEYERGMPAFENQLSLLPSIISNVVPTDAYSVDQYFDGSSIFYGIQAGFAYKVNDMISASVGFRYVMANNHYTGYLKDVMVNPGGNMMSAQAFFTANNMPAYAAMVADKEVKTTQTAQGFTPILGLNITPTEDLNVGIRWEGQTDLDFENDTEVDGTGMFPDGAKSSRDIPMTFSVGAQYKFTDDLRAQLGYHLYMDKQADWSGREDLVDDNLYELSFGVEYDLNAMFTLSAGYLMGKTGVSEHYQDNLSFSLSSNTYALGAQIHLSEALSVDLGFGRMLYVAMDENDAVDPTTGVPAHATNYDKDGYMFAIGLNYSLF